MSAETKSMALNKNWISLTDGTQTATLQVSLDAVRVVSSDVQPGADDEGFILMPDLWTITPPTKAWVRAHNSSAKIVYTVE